MKFLIILCVVGVAFALPEDACQRKCSEVCTSRYPTPQEVPETAEGLKNVCGYFSDIMPCIKEFVDKCGTLNADLFRGYVLDESIGNIIETTKAVCRPGSKIHKVIVEKLSCLKEVSEGEAQYCQQKEANTLRLLREHLGSEDLSPFRHVKKCLFPALSMNCYVGEIYRKCGSDAKDASLEFLEKFKILTNDCRKTLHPEFLMLLDLVKMLTKEEIYVRKFFE
ncbi:uncharacterized protein CEXT_248971 [Caerostris extrusa]|uniref:Uncharacterized protein n=1 Tax=Caerostris extrusa TaxID=172846 RepID=A0AAV4UR28_CAEEX|nr:uncharacterized protein CEXT_248971 [Caerostris extrusa]